MERLPRLLVPLAVSLSVSLVGFIGAPVALASAVTPAKGPDMVPAPAGAAWPLHPEPEVVSGFAPPTSRWGPGHRGVDLRGALGQPVRAAVAGTVTFAGRLAGRGVVVVSHGRTRTTYEPVTASVGVGDPVRAGTMLGRLELFGSHCFPAACLHWGLLAGERYLDPLSLVGSGPVRLLPWRTGHGGSGTAGPGSGTLPPDGVPQLPGWRPLGDAALFRA